MVFLYDCLPGIQIRLKESYTSVMGEETIVAVFTCSVVLIIFKET